MIMVVYTWEICRCAGLPVVLRAAEVPFDRGGVMPTWAVMPLLQEPVWDIWASAAAFWPVSSYWHWAWEDEEEEDFQREEPLLGSMPVSSSSSTFFRSWAPAQLLLTSGSACLDLLPFWTWRILAADIVKKDPKKNNPKKTLNPSKMRQKFHQYLTPTHRCFAKTQSWCPETTLIPPYHLHLVGKSTEP